MEQSFTPPEELSKVDSEIITPSKPIEKVQGTDTPEKKVVIGTTGRPGEFYLISSALSPEDLQGKKVLDVGCGRTNLETDMAKYGVHIDLTRVDTNVVLEQKGVINVNSTDLTTVLPASSFDVIFDSFHWAMLNEQDAIKTTKEIVKCLKSGGKAYIFPSFSETDREEGQKLVNSWLENLGATTSLVKPESRDNRLLEKDPNSVAYADPTKSESMTLVISKN